MTATPAHPEMPSKGPTPYNRHLAVCASAWALTLLAYLPYETIGLPLLVRYLQLIVPVVLLLVFMFSIFVLHERRRWQTAWWIVNAGSFFGLGAFLSFSHDPAAMALKDAREAVAAGQYEQALHYVQWARDLKFPSWHGEAAICEVEYEAHHHLGNFEYALDAIHGYRLLTDRYHHGEWVPPLRVALALGELAKRTGDPNYLKGILGELEIVSQRAILKRVSPTELLRQIEPAVTSFRFGLKLYEPHTDPVAVEALNRRLETILAPWEQDANAMAEQQHE